MSIEEIKKELENWKIFIDDEISTIQDVIDCIAGYENGWHLGIYKLDLENKIVEFGWW